MGRRLKYNKKTKVKRIPEELDFIIDRISNDAKKKSISDINLLNIALSKNDCNTIDILINHQAQLADRKQTIFSLRRDATSDVEDFIVKMSAYFDDDFGSLIKERKDAVDKLKRHCNRLISKYASQAMFANGTVVNFRYGKRIN